jgi:segregation and condensation protein B
MRPTLIPALEALLFASNHPLSVEALAEILEVPGEEVREALETLAGRYEEGGHGVYLTELAGGWQLLTRPEYGNYVERLLVGRRRARLSRAALETLAAIAYHQPVTKGEVDRMRGVDCTSALKTLLERELVAVKGRSDRVGRPLLYVTTPTFLETFGLRSLEDLPRLEDFAAMVDREALLEEMTSEEAEESEEGEPADLEESLEEVARLFEADDPEGSVTEPAETEQGEGSGETPPAIVAGSEAGEPGSPGAAANGGQGTAGAGGAENAQDPGESDAVEDRSLPESPTQSS